MSDELRKQLEELIQISDAEFDFVSAHFVCKKIKKRYFLVQIGEPVEYDYFIVKGLMKSSYITPEGNEHILQFASENWWITDYQAYFSQTPSTLEIACLEDVELLCLSLENREKLCSGLHKMEHFFRRKSNAGYVGLQRRILSLLSSNAKQRYEDLLDRYPQLIQRIPKSQLALYLGVTRETLSRLSK